MSVESLISDAREYTGSLTSQAASAMQAAIAAAGAVGYSVPGAVSLNLPNPPLTTTSLTPPDFPSVELVLPAAPDSTLLFQDIPTVAEGVAPTLTATAPTIDLPTTPSQLPSFGATAPSITTTFAFPDPPAELVAPVVDAPVLPNRAEPNAPQVTLPSLDLVRPTDTTVAPTGLETTFANSYATAAPSTITMLDGYVDSMLTKRNPEYAAQMARIEAQLTKYLEGGTALKPEIEDAIYARSRAKNAAEARRVRDAALNEAASRGFTIPPGSLTSAIQQARQAAADNSTKAAADIAIAQAEMEQKNLQFAVTTSTGLRTAMVNATLSYMQGLTTINGQALDYARSILNAVVETYNISVRAYTAKLDAYRADAAVYETKLKAALAGIEVYRAEIDALQALTQVDRAKVEVYQARIGVLNTLSNVYRGQVEAAQGRANLERLRIDLFQAQVQAYSVQVQAKAAEWQGFAAAVEGQHAKARIFISQVDAFNSQMQGYKTSIDAKVAAVQAAATTNDARSRNYAAKWSGYQTQVQALGEVARTKLENQRQGVIAFQAEAQAAVANAQVGAEYYRATSSVAIENSRLQLQAQVETAASQRAYGETLARLGTANAQIYSSLANAALSGMNTLAAETLTDG